MNGRKWMVGAALAVVAVVPNAQPPGFTRAVLQDQNISVQGRHAVVARAEFIPGGQAGKHTHPGEEIGYVLEGTVSLEIEGASKSLKAGDAFLIPSGKVHNATNTGSGQATILATYIVDKGKPLATPAK